MKILAVYYSQSGQLAEIIHNFISPIEEAEIDLIAFTPKNNFPFPWTDQAFYDAMPESVLEIPVEIKEIALKYSKYDLIIFGYQPWFLSPSIPAMSFLKSDIFKNIVKNTPVITIIGARNMWIRAQESVKKMIYEAGGVLVGNIPLIDKTTNLVSAVTIVHWMLTGKKTRKFGILPLPGVSESDIKGVCETGSLLNKCIKNNQLDRFQNEAQKAGLIKINPSLLFIEERAKKIFLIWANLVKNKGRKKEDRAFWLRLFKYYLLTALFVVSPIFLIIYNIFVRPFTRASFEQKKEYFSSTEYNNT
jgi:hypothetical protein